MIRSIRAGAAGKIVSLVTAVTCALLFRFFSSEVKASEIANVRGAMPCSPKS